MLDHGIYLSRGNCRIRPITTNDEDNVLELWNQDYVVGNLWSGRTSHETYREHFEKYVGDPNTFQMIVEDDESAFVGTIGYKIDGGCATTSWFALYPTMKFLPVVPVILLNDYLFYCKNYDEILFNVNSRNSKIKKLHLLLHAEYTGKVANVHSRYGADVIREYWHYTRNEWNRHKDFYDNLCK